MAFLNHWLLTILLVTPVAGAVAVLAVRRHNAVRWTALGVTWGTVVLSLLILVPFHWQRSGAYGYGQGGVVQMRCESPPLPGVGARYKVAVDGLSFPLVVLTTVICALACAASWDVPKWPAAYFALLLLLEATILGAVLAFDLLLLFVFLLLSLAPAALLTGLWGGAGRRRAAGKLLVYLLIGLACLLAAIVGEHAASTKVFAGGTLDLVRLASVPMQRLFASPDMAATGRMLFLLIVVGFLFRLPVVPLHTWLTDVLSESPAPVAILLGGLIPMTGGYGMLRVGWPLFPHAAASLWEPLAIVGVLTVLYAALCAIAQDDLKKLVAYGSISLSGFVLLGAAALTPAGANGAVFVLISNSLIVALMLLLAGMLSERYGHHDLSRVGGLGGAAPVYSAFFVVACLALLVIPGLLGQIVVVLGSFQAARPDSLLCVAGVARPSHVYGLCIAAGVGVILTGGYGARVLRRALGGTASSESAPFADLNGRETTVLAPLVVLTVLFGILPTSLCFAFTSRAFEAIFRLIS